MEKLICKRVCECTSVFAVNDFDGVYHCDGCGYPLKPDDWRHKYRKHGLKGGAAVYELAILAGEPELGSRHVQNLIARHRSYERIQHLTRINFTVGMTISVILTISSITGFFNIGSPWLHSFVLLVTLPLVAAVSGSTVYVHAKLRRGRSDA